MGAVRVTIREAVTIHELSFETHADKRAMHNDLRRCSNIRTSVLLMVSTTFENSLKSRDELVPYLIITVGHQFVNFVDKNDAAERNGEDEDAGEKEFMSAFQPNNSCELM